MQFHDLPTGKQFRFIQDGPVHTKIGDKTFQSEKGVIFKAYLGDDITPVASDSPSIQINLDFLKEFVPLATKAFRRGAVDGFCGKNSPNPYKIIHLQRVYAMGVDYGKSMRAPNE